MKKQSLRRDVLSTSVANTLDYALQFILPIVIARSLIPDDFAGYRMVWLVIGSLMGFATLQIPQSLSYFLPRIKQTEKIIYILGAMYILLILAILASLLVNPWFPILPLKWIQIEGPIWFYSVFIFIWVISSLLDWLPVADGRASWQARFIVTLAIVRVFSVSTVAWYYGTLDAVLYALILFAFFKLILLLFYILYFHKLNHNLTNPEVKKQLSYSWSFGVASGLYVMRQQAELWLVAALFIAKDFAAFSLGSIAAPLFGLIRKSVNNVVFPNMSAFEAKNDKKSISELNKKSTSAVAFILIPTAVFLWLYSYEVITLVYTDSYIDAGSVMRVYLLGVIPQVLESSTLLKISGLGKMALKIDFIMLPLVVLFSFIGIQFFGLPGGALGSVIALFIGHFIAIKKGATKLQLPLNKLYDFWQLNWIFLVSILSAHFSYLAVENWALSSKVEYLTLGGSIMVTNYLFIMFLINRIPQPLLNLFKK